MSLPTHAKDAASSRASTSSHHGEDTSEVVTLNDEKIAHTPDEIKPSEPDVQGPVILSAKRFMPIFVGLAISVFLISLDNTIISTAQVPIVEHLGGANLVLWLPTAYLLAQAAITLFFGQVLQIFSSKYVYLASLFIFELGSLVCALSPIMGALIAGRTVAGVGAAGLFMACFQIMIESTTVAARAQYMGFFGAIFAISMIAAPSIGGALSQHVSWRWCFYINLPGAVVAAAGVIFFFKSTPPIGTPLHTTESIREKLLKLDIVGTVLVSGFFVMIILPMQLSTTNGWDTAVTLAPLCCSILVLPLIWMWFRYLGDDRALIPLGLIRDKNLIGCSLTSFFGYWNPILYIYMIPFMFQTVRGSSPTKAGVEMLALMIPTALSSVVVGIAAKKTGQYYHWFLVSIVFGTIGAGLAWHLSANSSSAYQSGVQILLGIGVGPLIQMPILAVQANTKDKRQMSKANGIVVVFQRLGGGIGESVANAILYSQLPIQVAKRLPDGVDYTYVEPQDIFDLSLGPVRNAMLAGLSKTIEIVYVSAVPIYFFALLSVLCLIKITDVRNGNQTKKRDLIRKVLRTKKTSDVDGDVA